ncbi:MAG TPA: Pvc16 family protein [Gemmatimonadaceae bacterium]|jgi:hypothetical protein|nr:Pvc16 family protein [Gemmatimonadaceae bacterium]
MALANSVSAIGAVTDAIVERLGARTQLQVTVGRPEPGTDFVASERLNLFLYEILFDANLKNVPLDDGQRPPLWLVLKYLLTAFEDDGETSDSPAAYRTLGEGIAALQELSLLPLTGLSATVLDPLSDNPENLTITFDEAPTDLLSKVMQGSDEKYRVSIAFQVRPVMIAPAELPSYSLLVGVDYTATPVPDTKDPEKRIHIPVLPSLGPTITRIEPHSFELKSTVTIFGTDLHLSNLSVNLGPLVLPPTMQQTDRLQFVVRDDIANGGTISAGSHAVSVSQLLSTGRRRSSNMLVGHLLPTLSTAVAGAPLTVTLPPPPVGWKFATIDITGKLLGKTIDDDFYLALFKDGVTVKLFDALDNTSPPAKPQTEKQFQMAQLDAVPPGVYRVLYRVNGQQARQSFEINLQ